MDFGNLGGSEANTESKEQAGDHWNLLEDAQVVNSYYETIYKYGHKILKEVKKLIKKDIIPD